jgi:hypothetical protein
LIPEFEGRIYATEKDHFYSTKGKLKRNPLEYQPYSLDEEILGRVRSAQGVLLISQQGILQESTQQYLWKSKDRTFIEEYCVPQGGCLPETSGTSPFLLSSDFPPLPETETLLLRLSGFLPGLSSQSLYFSLKNNRPLFQLALGRVIGVLPSSDPTLFITEDEIFQWHHSSALSSKLSTESASKETALLQKLPLETSPPFLDVLQVEERRFVVTPEGIFVLEEQKLQQEVSFERGILQSRFMAYPPHYWCLSPTGQLFRYEKKPLVLVVSSSFSFSGSGVSFFSSKRGVALWPFLPKF